MTRREKEYFKRKVIIASVIVVVILFVIVPLFSSYYKEKNYVGTVTEKGIKNYYSGNNSKSKFLIFVTLDDGKSRVFSVEDTLIKGRINSADDYGQIQTGTKYQFTVIGWRIPLFSDYENIIRFKKID